METNLNKLKIKHDCDDIYKVFEIKPIDRSNIYVHDDDDDFEEIYVFTGNIVNCESFIRLHQAGYFE